MENRKDDILKSIEGAKRAQPDPQLYAAIQAKIAGIEHLQVVKRPYVALAAACLGLLIFANVSMLSNKDSAQKTPSVYQIEYANYSLYQ